jgi:hypothetical protein
MTNCLSLFILLCFPALLFAAPELYQKKPDIKTEATEIGDLTFFTFGFKDKTGSYHEWKWNNSTEKMRKLSQDFGLYNKNPKGFTYSPGELPEGLYKDHFVMGVLPDYNALVEHYYYSVISLYKNWKRFVKQGNLSKRESIELLLRFFQDFPYGVPPVTYEKRLISGLFVPPLIFKKGWADCDSKSLLMATVLAHDDYFKDKLAMILVPGHALLGLNIRPQVYDESYKHRGKTYVVAEPTGLGKTPLGRKNSPYKKILAIEPIRFIFPTIASNPSSQPSASPDSYQLRVLTADDCKGGAILIDYISAVENSRVQMCQIKIDGVYIKHGIEVLFNSTGRPKSMSVYNKGTKL